MAHAGIKSNYGICEGFGKRRAEFTEALLSNWITFPADVAH